MIDNLVTRRMLYSVAAASLLAVFVKSHDFYLLLHVACTAAFSYLGYWYWQRKERGKSFAFIPFALLFNPISPCHLSAPVWQVINCISAGMLIFALHPKQFMRTVVNGALWLNAIVLTVCFVTAFVVLIVGGLGAILVDGLQKAEDPVLVIFVLAVIVLVVSFAVIWARRQRRKKILEAKEREIWREKTTRVVKNARSTRQLLVALEVIDKYDPRITSKLLTNLTREMKLGQGILFAPEQAQVIETSLRLSSEEIVSGNVRGSNDIATEEVAYLSRQYQLLTAEQRFYLAQRKALREESAKVLEQAAANCSNGHFVETNEPIDLELAKATMFRLAEALRGRTLSGDVAESRLVDQLMGAMHAFVFTSHDTHVAVNRLN